MNSKSLSLLLLGAVACSSSSGPGASVGSGTGGSGTGGAIAGSGTGGAMGTGGRSDIGGTPAPSDASGGQSQLGGNPAGPGTGGSVVGTGSGGLAAQGGAGAMGPGTGGRGPSTTGGAAGGSLSTGGGTAGGASGPGGGTISSFAVVTDRYDNVRSASNLNETMLTTSNVTASKFGLLFSRTIMGYVYGQPLFVGGLTVNGAKHNVVYVATQHNMVYAFDADAPTPDSPLWSKSLGTSMTLGAGADYNPGCLDLRNEVGITSTPVISLADSKIYVVAKTSNDQQLHALDLVTGDEAAGSPVSVGKTAMPALDVRAHLNRPGLLLVNGTIYIAFGSHCDFGSYHGWIFGYDAKTLTLKSTYNSTPSGTQGAIWQSGVGLASDGTDLWATVGNGTSGGNVNMGNNVVRLTPTGSGLTVSAHYQAPVNSDNDLQSGAVLLGNTGQVVGGGKDGDILLLGQSDLSMKSKISIGGELNSFAFWNGSAGPLLFVWTVKDSLRAYQVAAGSLTLKGQNSERKPDHPSAIFTVSSNGTMAGTGIVWANVPMSGDAWHATATGALYAFDAANPGSASLWNSNLAASDSLGTYAKYSPPMVANGKVYVATFSGKLRVYGLK